MTVSTQTPINTYTGDGETLVFAYTFKILDEDDIKVYVDGSLKTKTTDYTVSGVGNAGGGDITFVEAPPDEETVRLERAITFNRTYDFVEGGGLASEDLDNDFDRVVMMVQEMERRSALASIGSDNIDMNGLKFTNLATPTAASDSATKGYVDAQVVEVESLEGLTDVTISDVGDGEVIQYWNAGGVWRNRTLAEAGIVTTSHTHTESDITDLGNYTTVGHAHATTDITSGTFADARIAETNVTQHEGALTITESQISDLQSYISDITSESILDLTDTPSSFTSQAYKMLRVNSSANAVEFVDVTFGIQFTLTTVSNGDYTIWQSATFAGTIVEAYYETEAGTVTASVKIDGVAITGLNALSMSTTEDNASASANNTFSEGDKIVVSLSSASSCEGASISLKCKRQ